MKETQREHKNAGDVRENAAISQNGIRENGAEKPQSWRQYIEESEKAEKRAEQEAAKARAARNRASKRHFQPEVLMQKAKAALSEAGEKTAQVKAALDQASEKRVQAKAARAEANEKQAQQPVVREKAGHALSEAGGKTAWMKAALDQASEKRNQAKAARAEANERQAQQPVVREKAGSALSEAGGKLAWMKAALDQASEKRNQAKAVRAEANEKQAQQPAMKEKASQAAKALGSAAGTLWEKTCAFTSGGWDKAAQATAKVRTVVARHPVSPLLYATLLAVVIGVSAFQGTYTRAYALNKDGQEIAVVSSMEDVDAIVSNIESRASDILGEHYNYEADFSLTEVYVTPSELSDTTQVADTLFEDVGALVSAYGLRVDGEELGYAPSSDVLYQMLDEVAQPYLTADTISYDFVENVEVYPVELPANTQYDLDSIWEILNQLEVEQAVYTVKKGDTFNAIAYSLDMWPNELSVLNPDVIVDKLWVDQELVIQQAVPYLSVQMVTDETYEQEIPSPVEYIETADLYIGDTQVKEQGEDGLERVNAHVTFVNGVEMDREIVTSETLKEPTTTYAYTGTTPRPVTASNGYFIWPVRGTITSNFGGRILWGSYDFHLGIDIAVPTGTAIKAADGGTVIKAGWSGSYGNLVAIRHDNGYVTYYAHNSSMLVSVGDKVYQGQIIARAGMTGNASGPHCHFEVRINGTSVNPRNYLP